MRVQVNAQVKYLGAKLIVDGLFRVKCIFRVKHVIRFNNLFRVKRKKLPAGDIVSKALLCNLKFVISLHVSARVA